MDVTRFAAVALLLIGMAGCGGPKVDSASRQTAAQEFALGVEAFDNRSYDEAAQHFTAALEQGGLNPDLYADAIAKRAVCYGAAARYDEALADLSKLEAGAPNLDVVYSARSFVLKKQGKVAEANAALAMARRFNRSVKEFQ